MPQPLPEPTADALAASVLLQKKIADEVQNNEGWISFARYMELALYAPALGYYSGGSAKLGKEGDFTTAPEMTPLFGRTVARAIAPLLSQTEGHIMEFGAGTGRLAHDILSEMQALGQPIRSYCIVDLSGELRARQQSMLAGFGQVRWLNELPERFTGVILGNEVLDAMPVSLVVRTREGWQERGVSVSDSRFVWQDRALQNPHWLAQIPDAEQLPEGYCTEVHPAALGFVRSVADMLDSGAALFIDYGFPAAEYYLPQRSRGTLMCHYRHRSHDDPFYLPGLQDITAHVDFSAVAGAAVERGLEVLSYTSQAAFLLQAGLTDLLVEQGGVNDNGTTSRGSEPGKPPPEWLRQTNAVQRLTSPAEMGELFKAVLLGRGVEIPGPLLRADRSHRL